MPTGARLFSAIFFGLLAYVTAHLVQGVLEAKVGYALDVGLFKEILAGIGVLCGWIVMGKRVGDGLNFAVAGGMLTSVSLAFWGILSFSIFDMVKLSMKLRYDGAAEAAIDTFRIALEHGYDLATPAIIATLLVGGILGGYVGEWAARRYR